MPKSILLSLLSLMLVFITDAQRSKPSAASSPASASPDLNAYYKPVKWRSIGPFRGGNQIQVRE